VTGRGGVDFGIRDTLADIGQTVANNLGEAIPNGESFPPQFSIH
jgi:phosphopentomutase